MKAYLISLDQSTTSTKGFLFDTSGTILSTCSFKHQQCYPKEGWVEHDGMEIYRHVVACLETLVEQVKEEDQILGIALTNQRETALAWSDKTKEPIHPAIVWQCRRTLAICERLKSHEAMVQAKTGLKIDPYFSASKFRWLLDQYDGDLSDIKLGTMDSWLIYKLTGQHLCDHTNASRTLLYSLQQGGWDDTLLDVFQIPKTMLPTIKDCDGGFGSTIINGRTIPIISVMGDSQSALYAHGANQTGDVKITLGTGSSVMMHREQPQSSYEHGVVGALAYHRKQQVAYASEAIINSSGDTMNWLREIGLFQKENELNDIAMDAHGVTLVPAFVGLGIPYWNAKAKACLYGISRSTQREHILAAGLQSIAFQICDAMDALSKDAKCELHHIFADGGASQNAKLMQFLADLSNCEIIVYEQSDMSAFGVYLLALQALGYSVEHLRKIKCKYQPSKSKEWRNLAIDSWRSVVNMVLYEANKGSGENESSANKIK